MYKVKFYRDINGNDVKHIEGDIWELRPLRDRIFFFSWEENCFILLHHSVKKT